MFKNVGQTFTSLKAKLICWYGLLYLNNMLAQHSQFRVRMRSEKPKRIISKWLTTTSVIR